MDVLLYYGLVKTLTKHQSIVNIYDILSITTLQIKYYIILFNFFLVISMFNKNTTY